MNKLASIVVLLAASTASAQYLNRFNYDETVTREDGYKDYEPKDWKSISCNEGSKLDECIGYPDKWKEGQWWSIKENYCRWCPAEGNSCGRHHQSPINVQRYESLWGNPRHKECYDWHWMKYIDSSCSIQDLERTRSFTVERFALRVKQPIIHSNDGFKLDCVRPGLGRRFGRIDYSKGFSQWWFLSHIDIKLPSEHTQDGIRYDAEIQLYHFYSQPPEVSSTNNQMGTVSIFMDVYKNAPPYRELDRLICQWRREEERVRSECGLPPIEPNYGPCFPNKRSSGARRNMRGADADADDIEVEEGIKTAKTSDSTPHGHVHFDTVNDLLIYNHQYHDEPNITQVKLHMDDGNWDEEEEKDWDAYIQAASDEFKAYEQDYAASKAEHGEEKTIEEIDHDNRRRLVGGDEIQWFNYFPMLGVRTEYYHRISGTQTIPPCYGVFIGSRKQTNHWRILKDPIRIHERQLAEMQRLIRERVSPKDYIVEHLQCQPDTAAKVDSDGKVDVTRPLQETDVINYARFCECSDWGSRWPEDRAWCRGNRNNYTRFYENIYNFETDDIFEKPPKPPQY